MLDLVSTRPNTDPQTARCARLLAAVIAEHIRDSALPATREDRTKDRMPYEARSAVEWIFDKGTTFDLYAHLIGVSPDGIRAGLMARTSGPSFAPGVNLNQDQRDTIRRRVAQLGLQVCHDAG